MPTNEPCTPATWNPPPLVWPLEGERALTAHLTYEQYGAYRLLVEEYWQRGQPLPDDNLLLSKITRSDLYWPQLLHALKRIFKVNNGRWEFPPLDQAIHAARLAKERQRVTIDRVNQKRWNPGGDDPLDLSKLTPEEQHFELFWREYPRRVARVSARKAFKRAWQKVDIDELLAAVKRAKKSPAWSKSGGEYVPYPATFLNQERWLDWAPGKDGIVNDPDEAAPTIVIGNKTYTLEVGPSPVEFNDTVEFRKVKDQWLVWTAQH